MQVYVLHERSSAGLAFLGLFATRAAAEADSRNSRSDSDVFVISYPVIGPLTQRDTVYVAQGLDRTTDTHYFLNVYGSLEDAKGAPGYAQALGVPVK